MLPAPETIQLPSGQASFLSSRHAGRPVIMLLHGGGLDCASLSWRKLFPALTSRYSVIAPDWPGHGETTPLGRPFVLADLSQWLTAFLDALEIEQADLMGVSMGGGAALLTALNHPARVRRLVPVATYGVQRSVPYHSCSYVFAQMPINALSHAVLSRSRWATRRALEAIFADPRRVSDEIVDEVRDIVRGGASVRAFSHFQRGELRWTGLRSVLTADLPSLDQPTLFVHGKADTLVPLAEIQSAAATMPRADVAVLDAGHWPMRECPDEFNDLVGRFLDQP